MLNTDIKADFLRYTSQLMRGDFSKLKDALNRAGMTQAEFAKRLNVQPSAVSNWIRGYATPSLGHVFEMLKVLDMTLSEILGEDAVIAETKKERDHLVRFRELDRADQEQLIRMAELMAKSKKDPS